MHIDELWMRQILCSGHRRSQNNLAAATCQNLNIAGSVCNLLTCNSFTTLGNIRGYHSGWFELDWGSICSEIHFYFSYKLGCELALTVIPPFKKCFGCCFDGSCLLQSLNCVLSLGCHIWVGVVTDSWPHHPECLCSLLSTTSSINSQYSSLPVLRPLVVKHSI